MLRFPSLSIVAAAVVVALYSGSLLLTLGAVCGAAGVAILTMPAPTPRAVARARRVGPLLRGER